MPGYKKRSLSSSSDEESNWNQVENRGEDDLYEYKVFTCDFCDEAFLNRYTYLVHNAKHIIIPLLRVTYFRCQECQLQCRTNRKLRKHMKKIHPHITVSHRINETKNSMEFAQSQVLINNNQNSVIFSGAENNDIPDTLFTNENFKIDGDIINIESDNEGDEFMVKENLPNISKRQKLQNKLIFEDEVVDIINPNGLINDLMADIKVSVPLEPWMSSITDEKKKLNVGTEPPDKETDFDEIWRSKTVSYQELTKMEDVSCNYCNETFPNRLSVIKHQPIHISSKRRHPFLCIYCDWYVASDPQTLRKHHIRSHSDEDKLPMQNVLRKTCGTCNLKYISKKKHMKNYHNIKFEDSNVCEHETDVFKPHFMKRIVKICDLCCSFLKNIPNNLYYKIMGEESISGERQTCGRCLKQYFSINLVEMTSRPKGARKPKSLSNMDRLKNFKNRLKLLNKIRKYLLLFYLPIFIIY